MADLNYGSVPLSGIDRIRVAIALTALKFKPDKQTFVSYVLALRSRFRPSTPSPPSTDGSWRTHALRLERDYAILQARLEAEQIRFLAMSAPFSTHQTTVSSSKNTSELTIARSDTAKKKAKKATMVAIGDRSSVNGRSDLKDLLDGLPIICDIFPCLTLETRGSLLSTVDSYFQLISSSPTQIKTPLFVSTAVRSIKAIAGFLKEILIHSSPKTSLREAVRVLSSLLSHLIITATSLIVAKAASASQTRDRTLMLLNALDTLFANLLALVFVPITHSFFHLSHDHCLSLLQPPSLVNNAPGQAFNARRLPSHICDSHPNSAKLVDVRLDILSLIRTSFCSLFLGLSGMSTGSHTAKSLIEMDLARKISYKVNSLKASMALEVIRELDIVLMGKHGKFCCPETCIFKERIPCHGFSQDHSASDKATSKSDGLAAEAGSNYRPDTLNSDEPLNRLAAKEAYWYMCAILHDLPQLSLDSVELPTYVITATASHKVPCSSTFNMEDLTDVEEETGDKKALNLLNRTVLDSLFELVNHTRPQVLRRQSDTGLFGSQASIRACGACTTPTGTNGATLDTTDSGKNPRAKAQVSPIRCSAALGNATLQLQGHELIVPDDTGTTHTSVALHIPIGGNVNFGVGPGGLCEAPEMVQGCSSTRCTGRREPQAFCHASGTQLPHEVYLGTTPTGENRIIDDVGYKMLLGVVERYVMELE